MTFEQLERFVAVAKYGNFTRAASSIFINTSTLSKSISDLEAGLGTQLFTRTRQNIALTDSGQVLYRNAMELISLMNKMESDIKNAIDKTTGKLTIISFPFESQRFVPLIKNYVKSFPRDDISMQRTAPGTVLQRLMEGEGDIALTLRNEISNSKIRRNFQYHFLESGEKRVIFSPDHPLAAKETITLEDLRGSNVLYSTYEGETSEKWVGIQNEELCRSILGDFCHYVPVDTMETLLFRVRMGMGISLSYSYSECIFGKMIVSRPFDTVSVKHVESELDDIVLVWDANNSNPALHRFLSLLPSNDKPHDGENAP